MKYSASRFWGGMFIWTKFFMPDTINLMEDRMTVTKKGFFGLTGTEEELAYTKVASVRLAKGVFTGHVIVETSGGATKDLEVKNFKKKVAHTVVDELRRKIAL